MMCPSDFGGIVIGSVVVWPDVIVAASCVLNGIFDFNLIGENEKSEAFQ